MKISFIGTRGIPATYGGFETCAQEISTRLAKMGHKVEVYCRSDWPGTSAREFKGVKLIDISKLAHGFLQTPFNSFVSTIRAAFSGTDIIHYFGGGNVPFILLARLAGKRIVITVDGIEWKRKSYPRLVHMYLRLFAELTMVFPNVTIADSRSAQTWYRERT